MKKLFLLFGLCALILANAKAAGDGTGTSPDLTGKKVVVYLDYAGKNLIAGNLFSLQTRTNLTQERLQEINRIDVSQIPLDDALVMGEKDAKYKVIVFDDPD